MRGGAALLLLAAAGAEAQEPPQEPSLVVEVVVEGNRDYTVEAIKQSLATRAGRPLGKEGVAADLRFLWEKMRIRAEFSEEKVPEGVRLHLRVVEAPVLREIEIRGNRKFPRARLLQASGLSENLPFDEIQAARARAEIQRFYREEGYRFAEVGLRIDPEPRRATFEVSEGPLVRVGDIEFEGNRSFPASTFLGLGNNLNGEMNLRGSWLFFRGSPFRERVLREDLIALRRFYRGQGFRDVIVELEDVVYSEDRTEVSLPIFIEEGPEYTVSRVEIEGNEAISTEEIRSRLSLRPGEPDSDEARRRDYVWLASLYGERGYPPPPWLRDGWDLNMGQVVYGEEEPSVEVTYRIREGPQVRIRDIRIEGNARTRDAVIRRQLDLFPGEIVNTTKLSNSLARLDSLQYFEDEAGLPTTKARLEPTGDPAWRDLVVEVTEGQTGNVGVGGGVSSVDGAFVQLVLTKRNFDLFSLPSSPEKVFSEFFENEAFTGGGQLLELQLAPGTRLSQYRLLFREPDLFGDHLATTSLSTDLYRRVRRFADYREDRRGGIVGIGKNLSKTFGIDGGLRLEEIEVDDVDTNAPAILFDQEGKNRVRSVSVGAAVADVDVPLEPRQGYSLRGSLEVAGGPFGGDFDFWKASATGRLYLPLSRDLRGRAHVAALLGRVGFAGGYDETGDVPFTERFFSGGPGSVRGFDFRGIGPKQNDEAVGGEAVANLSLEYRFPVYSTAISGRIDEQELVRGRLFLDSGTLGLDASDPSFREVRVGAGIGLSIRLPIFPLFPISLDFAVPVRREETDDVQGFSFSIGNY